MEHLTTISQRNNYRHYKHNHTFMDNHLALQTGKKICYVFHVLGYEGYADLHKISLKTFEYASC